MGNEDIALLLSLSSLWGCHKQIVRDGTALIVAHSEYSAQRMLPPLSPSRENGQERRENRVVVWPSIVRDFGGRGTLKCLDNFGTHFS